MSGSCLPRSADDVHSFSLLAFLCPEQAYALTRNSCVKGRLAGQQGQNKRDRQTADKRRSRSSQLLLWHPRARVSRLSRGFHITSSQDPFHFTCLHAQRYHTKSQGALQEGFRPRNYSSHTYTYRKSEATGIKQTSRPVSDCFFGIAVSFKGFG